MNVTKQLAARSNAWRRTRAALVAGVAGIGLLSGLAAAPANAAGYPDIVGTQTVSNAPSQVGEPIFYGLRVSNSGGVTLDGITITGTLAGLSTWSGAWNTPGRLQPGEWTQLQATYVLTDADLARGFVENTTTVIGHAEDGVATSHTSSTVLPVNAPHNLALSGTATQSSTWAGGNWMAFADRAIDGNTDGDLSHGSVTHTDVRTNPWWQIDLGASRAIRSVEVFNRTDCCMDRLNGARVFVSDKPFDVSLDPATQATRPGVTSFPVTAAASTVWDADRSGRYVMVQVPGWQLFSLAEVRVIGTNR